MENKKCIECGYMAVVNHDGYLVCEECSTVQGEDMITSKHQDVVGYQPASENLWIMKDKNKLFRSYNNTSQGELAGQSNIKVYGNIFHFSPSLVESANNMFSTLFKDPDIKNKTIKNKIDLSFGCLFFVGRKNNSVVSVKKFSEVAQIPVSKIVESMKLIGKKLNMELPVKSVIEITLEISWQHNIKSDVISTTLDILHVCDRAWLLTGRQPQKPIWSAIYIASKSIKLVELSKVTFTQFMKSYDQKRSAYADGTRLNEMLQCLTDLGENIPWATNKGGKNFVFCNLRDIIKYSEMTMKEKKRELLKTLENEEEEKEEIDTISQKRKWQDDNDENIDIYRPPILKHPRNKSSIQTETETSLEVYFDCEPEHLGPEIDKELDSYIRLPEEVLEIKKARELIIDGK